jgi:hypothetical protein
MSKITIIIQNGMNPKGSNVINESGIRHSIRLLVVKYIIEVNIASKA